MAALYLGIEIGGTKLQAGLGSADGRLIALEHTAARAEGGAEAIRGQVIELVELLLRRHGVSRQELCAVGVGFGGPVDVERGQVTKSHQVSGWEGFPLAEWLSSELGAPVVVHNDADTAGLAEALVGAGSGTSPVFYITVGSGIGGGLIIDGRIYRGCGPGASEIGHLLVPPFYVESDGRLRWAEGEQERRTVESVCSGWSIARRMRVRLERILAGGKTGGAGRNAGDELADAEALVESAGGLESVTVETIGEAAAVGNKLALGHLLATWRVLGWAVAQMITLLCPARVVIGGGVSLLGEELMFEPLRAEVARMVFPPFAGTFSILPSSLGQSVVVQGAVLLALSLARADASGRSRSNPEP